MGDPTLRDVLAPIVRDLVAGAAAEPLMISQANCEALLGIPVRTHLENCRRADFTPKVHRVGKLRIVDAREYQVWIRTESARTAANPMIDPQDEVLALAAKLGLHERERPNPGRRGRS